MGERLWPTSKVDYAVLYNAARKLGLDLKEGKKHTLIIQIHTSLQTQIPRHRRVKQGTARNIVRYMIEKMGLPENDVIKALGAKQAIFPKDKKETENRGV